MPPSFDRILVIRGGAIGDFVLTLPAIKLLRDQFRDAHLEILGYKQIAALAENRYYANAVRSLESADFARFFARDAELPAEPARYFSSFDLIISYLFDPDGIFAANINLTANRKFVSALPSFGNDEHAARKLARALEGLDLHLENPGAKLFPSEADRVFAANFLRGLNEPIVALHPGSGSEKKNWPIENWRDLGTALLEGGRGAESLLVVGGEADGEKMQFLRAAWSGGAVRFATEFPLPHVAALLENCERFIGHDSGISHIAAAVGTRCVLLFGPTNPAVWAPANENVTVLQAPEGYLPAVSADSVRQAIDSCSIENSRTS